jgi:hypothetical protein
MTNINNINKNTRKRKTYNETKNKKKTTIDKNEEKIN